VTLDLAVDNQVGAVTQTQIQRLLITQFQLMMMLISLSR
jgi:hypothetical protein